MHHTRSPSVRRVFSVTVLISTRRACGCNSIVLRKYETNEHLTQTEIIDLKIKILRDICYLFQSTTK